MFQKIILQAEKHSFFRISDMPSFLKIAQKKKEKFKEIYHTLLTTSLNAMQFSFNPLWEEKITFRLKKNVAIEMTKIKF